ncbi:flagellar basal body rod protein FlgC [Porticoccaceae bacterium]|jgi:flagellar basal-body rod protein FlgC|nr:flagellar basal body rod protein FlgC [Porticoccaceae bacterium]MDB9999583.1 flagellar basal body rod protein FlgC [Porticoccaceae bacterium]
MSLNNIFGIAGTALNAQMVRMNATASNMANSGTIASSEADAFKAKRPVFETLLNQQMTTQGAQFVGGVRVSGMVDDNTPNQKLHDPGNPKADKDGFVYVSNVNEVTEMVDMMGAARSYQNNVEVVNTARELMMRTLDITKA